MACGAERLEVPRGESLPARREGRDVIHFCGGGGDTTRRAMPAQGLGGNDCRPHSAPPGIVASARCRAAVCVVLLTCSVDGAVEPSASGSDACTGGGGCHLPAPFRPGERI